MELVLVHGAREPEAPVRRRLAVVEAQILVGSHSVQPTETGNNTTPIRELKNRYAVVEPGDEPTGGATLCQAADLLESGIGAGRILTDAPALERSRLRSMAVNGRRIDIDWKERAR